jgi:hypothetical protein
MRNGRPCGASFAATCDGVKKNTRLDWKTFSTSTRRNAEHDDAQPDPRETTMPCLHDFDCFPGGAQARPHADHLDARSRAPSRP